jgi:hypothetical protein
MANNGRFVVMLPSERLARAVAGTLSLIFPTHGFEVRPGPTRPCVYVTGAPDIQAVDSMHKVALGAAAVHDLASAA